MVTVGTQLNIIRTLLGLKQSELARAAGVTQFTISAIETGQRGLSPSSRARIEAAIGISLDDPRITLPIQQLTEVIRGHSQSS